MSIIKLLDTLEAASYLKKEHGVEISPATLVTKRSRAGGPPFVKVVGKARYEPCALDAWAHKEIIVKTHTGDDGEEKGARR